MRKKLKRSNTKRLASLSALGAGALGIPAVPAHASDVVFSGVIDVTVEFPLSLPWPWERPAFAVGERPVRLTQPTPRLRPPRTEDQSRPITRRSLAKRNSTR